MGLEPMEMREQSPSKKAIQVVVVDDHPLICDGVRAAFRPHDDIELVGEARSGGEALKLMPDLAPDVVLMDYRLPDTDGISVIRDLRTQGCDAHIIVLTCHADEHCVRSAIDEGAVGFLTKGSVDIESLVDAVRNAGRGLGAVSPDALHSLMDIVRHQDPAYPDHLTKREREVWRLVSLGKSNGEIAAQLFLSERTVKFHVGNLLRKTGARTRAEATALAYRQGFMDLYS